MVYGELNKIVKLLLPSSGPLKKQLNLGEEVLGGSRWFQSFSPSSFTKASPDHAAGMSSQSFAYLHFEGKSLSIQFLKERNIIKDSYHAIIRNFYIYKGITLEKILKA